MAPRLLVAKGDDPILHLYDATVGDCHLEDIGREIHEACRAFADGLAIISSLAAIRGGADAPAFNASKAFVSSYLQGLRQKIAKLGIPIYVTDIRPGFVDTAMAKGEGVFWVQSPRKAAGQIYEAVQRKRKVA